MILWMLTASELTAFRCCCTAYNAIFTHHESFIIHGILRNRYYNTVSTLHGVGPASGQLSFNFLKFMVRRCEIAEILAMTIAERHVEEGFEARKIMACNIKPYLLAQGHFFEKFRTGIADHANNHLFTPSDPSVRARLQGEILKGKYNGRTYHRMWLTHFILNRIYSDFSGLLFYALDEISPEEELLLPLLHTCEPIDLYLFCGLEIFKDVLVQPDWKAACRIGASHFAKMTQIPTKRDSIVALPPSVLGLPLSRATVSKIHELFPVMDQGQTSPLRLVPGCPIPHLPTHGGKVESLEAFLEYLKTYEGEEPELVHS